MSQQNRVGFPMETYDVESSALHRKLQSKSEALKIMRNDLELYRTERDQFKLMAETLQMRYSALKNSVETCDFKDLRYGEGSNVGTMLNHSREKNISLNTEIENLKQKLQELQGDIKILRSKNLEMMKQQKKNESQNKCNGQDDVWNEEKSRLIAQLEKLKKKNAQLQFDFRSLLDEKEEIITERDVYKCKAHRLNHELNVVLKGGESDITHLDVDALILENKFLTEQTSNLENELEHAKQSASKFKTMLETKRVKGIIKLGNTSTDNEMIMSHKQVKKLVESGSLSDLPLKADTISDLKALCMALLDNLNDKNLALSHQKKTNRLLGAKIGDLEHRIKLLSNDKSTTALLSPSQILLNGYTSSQVDRDLKITKDLDDPNVALKNYNIDHFSTDSTRSMISSEYGEKSSDISSEYNQSFLHHINIIENDDLESNDDDDDAETVTNEKLEDLPPEIAKLMEEALRNSREADDLLESGDDR